jgi:DUF1680 family protein
MRRHRQHPVEPGASDGGIERRPWYRTACCPSNISRLWAELDRLVVTGEGSPVRIEQYPSCRIGLPDGLSLRVQSAIPWQGTVRIEAECPAPARLLLRAPGWANRGRVTLGGRERHVFSRPAESLFGAGRFTRSRCLELELGKGNARIEIDFPMEMIPLVADPRVRPDAGRIAVTRGPLVFCAESVDNPDLDLEDAILAPGSLAFDFDPGRFDTGCGVIRGETAAGKTIRLVPYFAWGNRGASSMRVWLRADSRG